MTTTASNQTALGAPEVNGPFATLVDRLRWRAEQEGDSIAFWFLGDGDNETDAFTCARLDTVVRALAGRLQEAGLAGQRALLLYPSEPSYLIAILACLYAGVVAVPMAMPRPNRGLSHLEAVARDTRAHAILTTHETFRLQIPIHPLAKQLGVKVLFSDDAGANSSAWSRPEYLSDSVAYLQYTSGSTTSPKGVVMTHDNLIHNCMALADVIQECGPHVAVSWMPFFHDMGLVGTVFLPLWMGFPIAYLPAEAFIMKPVRWLRAVSRYRGTISPAPNFAYETCVNRVTSDQLAGLELSSWRIAFNGAERVDPGTLDRFAKKFGPAGFQSESFMPSYGLAESTLVVTCKGPRQPLVIRQFNLQTLAQGWAALDENGAPLVSCGRPVDGVEVIVVDSVTRKPLPTGRVGEIWVSGRSTAAGYWNNLPATLATFHARLSVSPSASFLRTGDIGFFFDGELYVTGRLKDMIIIGGRNISAEDIEMSVENAHPAITVGGAIAFALASGPRERLVVIAEVERQALSSTRDAAQFPHANDAGQIMRAVRDAVARQNDVAVDEMVLVKPRRLPRTHNGKKMRAACREAFVEGAFREACGR